MVFAFGSFVGGKVNSLLGEGEANKDENNGLPNVNFSDWIIEDPDETPSQAVEAANGFGNSAMDQPFVPIASQQPEEVARTAFRETSTLQRGDQINQDEDAVTNVTPSRITPEKMLDLILAEDVYNRQIASLRERYLGRVDRLEDPFAGRRPERDRLPCYGSYVYDSSSDDYSDWQDASAGEHLVQEEREESQPNNGQGNLESGDVDLQEATIIQELQQPGELYNAEVIAGANAEASNEESDEPLGENFGQDTQQGDVDLEVVRDGADEVTPNPTEKSSESVVKEQNVGIASQHSFSRLIFFQQPTRYARLYPAQSLQEPQPFQGVAQNAVGALVVGPPASQAQPPLNTAQSTGPPATQRPTPPAEASHDEAITTPAQPANTRYRRPPHRARAQKLTNRDFYNTAEYDRNPTGFDAAHQELGTASMAGIDGNPAINEYLRQYYPPGTRLFKGAGEFREQNTWYEALTDQEQDVFRRFAWERIESRFPQTFRERLAWLRGTPPIVGYRAPPTARGNKTQQGRKRGRDAQDLENNSNGGDMQAPLPRRKKLRRSNRGMNAEVPAPSRPHPIPVREETTPHGVKRQRDDIEPATAEGDSDSQDVLEPPIKKSRQSADRETRVDSRSMPGAGLQPSSDSMLPMNLLEESQLGRDQHQRSEMGLLGLPRRQIRGRTQTRHRPRIAPRAPTASLSERGANTAHSSMTEEPHRQTGFAVFDSLNQSAAEPQEEADVGYRYPSPTRYEQPRPDSLSSGYGHQAQERSTSQTNRCSDSGYGSERALEEFRGEIWAQVNHDGGSPGGKHQTEMVEGQQPNGVSVDPHRHWNMFEPERNRSAVLEADDEGHDDYLVHEKAKSTKRRRRSPGQK